MSQKSNLNFRYLYGNTQVVNLKNGSSALSEGDMVNVSSNVLAEVADANTSGAVGVLATDAAASAWVPVYVDGVFEGKAATGVDFGVYDPVYTAGADTLDAGSASDVSVGYVVDTDPSSAGYVRFYLHSHITQPVTHA